MLPGESVITVVASDASYSPLLPGESVITGVIREASYSPLLPGESVITRVIREASYSPLLPGEAFVVTVGTNQMRHLAQRLDNTGDSFSTTVGTIFTNQVSHFISITVKALLVSPLAAR